MPPGAPRKLISKQKTSPENLYRKLVANLLRSEEQLKVGGHYIDRDGTILAINPSAEKLRTILNEKLGDEESH